MKVDFMIVGAQKCGTTTLFDILKAHPEIVGCREKEPHFFSKTADWRKHLPDYEALFDRQEGALYFEASTSYTFYPILNLNIWEDIHEYNPEMRIIYLVRNPVDKIISAYMHAFERGYESRSIEEAICRGDFLLSSTRYYTQIAPFIATFGRERVLLIDFDDLVNRIDQVIERISTFLGVSSKSFSGYESMHNNASLSTQRIHHEFDEPRWHHKLIKRVCPSVWNRLTDNAARVFEEKPTLGAESREVIVRSLMLDISALERLMDKDLSGWYRDVL